MSIATNVLTAVIVAPVITILSALSLATLQRGIEWVSAIAKNPQKGHLKTLRPYFKNVDVILERILGGQKFAVNATTILLMTIAVLLLVLILEGSGKPKNVKIVKAAEGNDKKHD